MYCFNTFNHFYCDHLAIFLKLQVMKTKQFATRFDTVLSIYICYIPKLRQKIVIQKNQAPLVSPFNFINSIKKLRFHTANQIWWNMIRDLYYIYYLSWIYHYLYIEWKFWHNHYLYLIHVWPFDKEKIMGQNLPLSNPPYTFGNGFLCTLYFYAHEARRKRL